MNDSSPFTENPNKINDFLTNQNSPENAEQTRKEADNILMEVLNNNISDLKKNLILSCLRINSNLYKDYAESIKEHPEYQKYLQFYNFKGKNFLIIPLYNKNEKSLIIKTIETTKENGEITIGKGNAFDSWDSKIHPYTKDSNVLQIMIHDNSQHYGYSIISMNKWTGEITDVDPASYKQNEKGIKGLIDTIEKKSNSKLENCSEGLQSNFQDILSKEDKLKQESHNFEQQKSEFIQHIRTGEISQAFKDAINIANSFFKGKKEIGRTINIGEGIKYEGDDKDTKYLESAIDTILDPEQRSKLTYLLSKIKDKHTKEGLKEKGIENPTQFDLLLQHLQPGQIMLTNALDLEGQSSSFKYATQTISGGRWCHAAIISEVKEENGIITDATIIQSTLKGGVHETTLKDYIEKNYSSADLLIANLPNGKTNDFIKNAKNKIGEKYDRVSIVTDSILGFDVDNSMHQEGVLKDQKENLMGKNKAYCSELVFDAMNSSGIKMPEPHMSPSDILLTDNITPQYACYCNNF